jgi:hypothetical protein
MILGISGKAGSGKDTVADFILEHEGFIKISLADPIKRFAMDVWDFSEKQMFGDSKYRNIPDSRYVTNTNVFLTPRLVLQQIGTECTRYLDSDVWIRYAIRISKILLEAKPGEFYYSQIGGLEQYPQDLGDFPSKVKCIVIPDVRFINEVKHIKNVGGKLLRVIRPGAGLEGSFANHQSESEMDNIQDDIFDKVIINTGTLDDLKTNVEDFLNTLSLT